MNPSVKKINEAYEKLMDDVNTDMNPFFARAVTNWPEVLAYIESLEKALDTVLRDYKELVWSRSSDETSAYEAICISQRLVRYQKKIDNILDERK